MSSSSHDDKLATLLDLLPSAGLSRAFGAIAELELPAYLQGRVNRFFARRAGIDLSESERDPESYSSLNAFFTRNLRAGVREIDTGEDALVCPVDGTLSEHGPIADDGTLIQAKGRTYSVAELLNDDPDLERFEGGAYATLYLSPRDYHKIHSPIDGEVTAMSYAPGRLLPVNRLGVRHVQDLFPRNERLTSFVERNDGRLVAVVKVGATCVGKISVGYDPFATNCTGELRAPFRREYADPNPVSRGDELGVFNLGSTVVLIIEGRDFEFEPSLEVGQPVRMGMRLGRWRGASG